MSYSNDLLPSDLYSATVPLILLISNNFRRSMPDGQTTAPFLSTHATTRGLTPYVLYKSAARDRMSFAKLCPTTPNPTIIRRNLDSGLVNFDIYLTYSLCWCFLKRRISCLFGSYIISTFYIKYKNLPNR
jgi:hypothetical protein